MDQITFTAVPDMPLIHAGDELAPIVSERMRAAGITFRDGDVLVVAQKVVSKCEGRLVRLRDVQPSPTAREVAAVSEHDPRLDELILQESNEVLKLRKGLVIVEQRSGFICANAGIDRSNIEPDDGEIVVSLLPLDPDASARRLRADIERVSGASLAVLIVDTHGRPFRNGVCGVAIGVAGMKPLRDARGELDLFGFALQHTVISPADEIAAGASMLMGQSGEGRPVVLVRGARYERGEGSIAELIRERALDLFRPEPVLKL
jgi:coenzyme F420-0:L-glutamate ligase / coenzyme F420-1:gamma-L-glutamate ligase